MITGEEKLITEKGELTTRGIKYDSPESQFFGVTLQVTQVVQSETKQVIGSMKEHKRN